MAPADPTLQVVVLAAGMGTRLGRDLPKPLTPLADGRTILRRQVDAVRAVLGSDVPVTAVVGHRAGDVRRAAPDLLFADAPAYATTNTAKSLLLALRGCGPGGVLWLNGDVVFDPAVLEALAPAIRAGESVVCVDTSVVGEEEIKYTLDGDGCIRELSKTVTGGLGEAVGINHVGAADREALIEHLDSCADTDYFERGMETAIGAGRLRFRPLDIGRFYAVEVDFESDLERANARLRAASG